jgi:hypothetical protein
VIQIVGGGVALALLILTGRSAWAEVADQVLRVRLDTAALAVLSLVVTLLGVIAVWRVLLSDLGVPLPYGPTLQLWSFSNLGRYLPGKVWQVVGLVVVSRDLGVPPGVVATGGFIALGLAIGTGAIVGALALPGALAGIGWASVAVVLLAAGLFVPVVWPGVVTWVIGRLPAALGCAGIPPIRRATMLRLVALFVVTWFAHGASFLHFSAAFGSVGWSDLPGFTGAYVLAHVTGLVAVFAPGGLGVREGMLGHLLTSVAPTDLPAHVVAVAARLWSIAAEALVLVLAVTSRLLVRRGSS